MAISKKKNRASGRMKVPRMMVNIAKPLKKSKLSTIYNNNNSKSKTITKKKKTTTVRRKGKDSNIFEVERLRAKKMENGVDYYLVKWKDYDQSESTWEPEVNILSKSLISDYEKEMKEEKAFSWEYYLDAAQDQKEVGWYPYAKEAIDIVEKAYQSWQRDPYIDIREVQSGHWSYSIDFRSMQQTNVTHPAHRIRKIRRMSHNK